MQTETPFWSRTLHECVDWNWVGLYSFSYRCGRTLHECVDWNYLGLKMCGSGILSHSTRVRGLKLPRDNVLLGLPLSHSTRVRGLKYLRVSWQKPLNSRTLHECVDWNSAFCSIWRTRVSRTLHECVDWNFNSVPPFNILDVALYTSAWIEIPSYQVR